MERVHLAKEDRHTALQLAEVHNCSARKGGQEHSLIVGKRTQQYSKQRRTGTP
jgi:hypothetical protein